jgi:hypothetical protein
MPSIINNNIIGGIVIITELKYQVKFPDRFDNSQRINVKCDGCEKIYDSVLSNRNICFEKYKADLCSSCKMRKKHKNGVMLNASRNAGLASIRLMKGKSFEEIFGDEKAKKIKKIQSLKSSGKNNKNFGGKYSRGFADRPLFGTFEERYGKEKADEMKSKISSSQLGSKNAMFGKPSPTGSGNGWSGWYKGYYFRSLLELSYLVYLIDNDIKFEHAEHKKYAVKYLNFEGMERNYFPDFYIFETDEIVEIKPKHLVNTIDNKSKFNAARELFKNFKVVTEEDIKKITTDEIKTLYKTGDIKFIERYDVKFKERYL